MLGTGSRGLSPSSMDALGLEYREGGGLREIGMRIGIGGSGLRTSHPGSLGTESASGRSILGSGSAVTSVLGGDADGRDDATTDCGSPTRQLYFAMGASPREQASDSMHPDPPGHFFSDSESNAGSSAPATLRGLYPVRDLRLDLSMERLVVGDAQLAAAGVLQGSLPSTVAALDCGTGSIALHGGACSVRSGTALSTSSSARLGNAGLGGNGATHDGTGGLPQILRGGGGGGGSTAMAVAGGM